MEFEIRNDVPQHEDEFLELLYRCEAAEIRSKILEEELMDYTRNFASQISALKSKMVDNDRRFFTDPFPPMNNNQKYSSRPHHLDPL